MLGFGKVHNNNVGSLIVCMCVFMQVHLNDGAFVAFVVFVVVVNIYKFLLCFTIDGRYILHIFTPNNSRYFNASMSNFSQ